MFSLEYIKAIQSEKTKEARRLNRQPCIADCNEDEEVRHCPFLAYYIPEGWEVTNKFFVDSSGFGQEGEGALTFPQFLAKVKEGYGYGIYEEGDFQVYIREYRKI